MTLTNHAGLPEAIIRAMEATAYTKGDAFASVTELAGPTRLAMLRRLHASAITEDAADRIWSLLGTLMHELLSKSADANVLHEERLTMKLPSGLTMSGAMDHYTLDAGGTLSDYKLTTVWSTRGEVKPEWVAQASGYAILLRAHGFPVGKARVVMVLRDWNLTEATRKRSEGWPQQAVDVKPVSIWTDHDALVYFERKALALAHAIRDSDAKVCEPAERWQKAGDYAVMAPGASRARRKFDTKEEADAFAHKPGEETIFRPGEDTRCMDFDGRGYCPVRQFCDYAQALRGDLLMKGSENE